jgi:hypothetical protein
MRAEFNMMTSWEVRVMRAVMRKILNGEDESDDKDKDELSSEEDDDIGPEDREDEDELEDPTMIYSIY